MTTADGFIGRPFFFNPFKPLSLRTQTMRFSSMILFCLLPFVCGCGGGVADQPELATVSGQVTLGGQPLPNVILTFKPVGEGRSSSGVSDDDGYYSLQYTANAEGAMIAKHSVKVAVVDEDNGDGDYAAGGGQTDSKLPASATDGSMEKEVKAGANTINIEL